MPVWIRRDLVLAGLAAGDNLPGYESYPSMGGTLRQLKEKGFAPLLAVDVGAFRGEWTQLWNEIFPLCDLLMIEPQQSKTDFLKQLCREGGPKIQLETALLGAANDSVVCFQEMEGSSSVFGELSDRARVLTYRPTVTLDTVLAVTSAPSDPTRVNFLKIDAQGYELEILKGAERTLTSTELVLLEASLIPINEGCPLVSDVLDFMKQRRFVLFDICGQWRRRDHTLWQVDLLFIAEAHPLAPKPELSGQAFGNWSFSGKG